MENEETPILLPLHPKELSDEEFSVYEAEFEKVFSDPFCRNIALSGSYGAGKSSVMEKVKKRQQGHGENWITISLATFEKTGDKQESNDFLSQNTVEAEILKQMIHKIGTSMAPKSRFRKLSDRSRFSDMGIVVLILLFVLLTIYLSNIIPKLFSFQLSCVEGFACLVWLIIASVGLYRLVRTNAISKIVRRVKLFEAELEVNPSDSASPYERCADEIVYLLNTSDVDIVVFEDLDRFDSVTIFERMRNLNALSNDSRSSDAKKKLTKKGKEKAKKPLRFFFLVRDGLFKNPHDRTKFFDYIIPVVPYIDPNSALDIFRNALGGVGITVDEGFLYQLSSYIDDPRIIHDIANEAYHYKKALFASRSFADGDSERLIALLAYKALFPKDFEYLQVGRGYLHEVLNGKQRLIAKLIGDSENERSELQDELSSITNQLKVSEDELICMFGVNQISENYFNLLRYVQKPFNPHSFLETIRQDQQNSQTLNSILENLDKNDQYRTRLSEVRKDAHRRSEIIRVRLQELETESKSLRAMTIRRLINELPDADVLFNFESKDIKREKDFKELSMDAVLSSPSFPLLRFLVSSGYIDESYRRYTSNFYSDTLCAEDDDFLSAIKQAKQIDLDYQPKAPEEIVRRISQEEFSRTSIRNPWLVSALFSSEDDEKIDEFMSSVKRSGGTRYLAEFIVSEQFTPEIFVRIPTYFNSAIAQLLSDEGISADDKRCFCKRCLTSKEGLRLIKNESDTFKGYIDSDPRFLEEDSRFDVTEIGERLRCIRYRADAIDFSNASRALLDFVYDNRLFMPAPSIVDGYLNLKFGMNGSMDHGTLITDVLKLSDSPIKDVAFENIEYFVAGVVGESDVPLMDASESVIRILNEEGIHPKTVELYIDALADVEIEDITQVNSADYRDSLLKAQLVKCNANNVISFFQWAEDSISDDLARLIETKGAPIDLNDAKCKEACVNVADIVGEIITYEAISAKNKKVVLSQCGVQFASFDIDGLDDETVGVTLETRTIEMNGKMLDKFRAYKPNLKLDYILSDLDSFLTLVDTSSSNEEAEREIEEDEVVALLGSNIDISKKLTALSCFDGAIRLDKSYETEVNTAIVAKHFDLDDIVNLPSYYEEAPKGFRDQIVKAFAMHDETVLVKEIEFGWDLLYDSLQYLKSDRARVLQLFTYYLREFGNKGDRDEITKCFEVAELEDYTKLIGGSTSMIAKSIIDDEMLSVLTELGMCGAISNDVNAEGSRKVYPKGYKRTK